MTTPSPSLDELRAAIDAIDRDWIALIDSRARLVRSIAECKARDHSPVFFPAVEARRLQRLVQDRAQAGAGTDGLPLAALGMLLAQVMAAMGHMQNPPLIALSATPTAARLIDAVRTQWGGFAAITRTPTDAAALSLVREGKVTHAVLPWIEEGDSRDAPWWDLIAPPLCVVSVAPLVAPAPAEWGEADSGLVVMARSFDPSLADRSLIRIRTDGDITRNRLTEMADSAGLSPLRITSHRRTALADGRAVHCLECAGYCGPDDTRLAVLRLSFETDTDLDVIGGYPVIHWQTGQN